MENPSTVTKAAEDCRSPKASPIPGPNGVPPGFGLRQPSAAFQFRFELIRRHHVILLALLFAPPILAQELPESLLTLPPEKAGQILVEHIRSGEPAERAEYKGKLRIAHGASETQVPVTFILAPDAGQWHSVYKTSKADATDSEKLNVVHKRGQPNIYLYGRAGKEKTLKPEEAFLPFGASDFWLVDLGLDFFNWPVQRVLKGEMKLSRYAYVLESRLNKVPANGYSRVVSWIDRETGGPLAAEAYDANGKLLKEFNVRRFKKVKGQWQLREMRIRNVQARSTTTIEFDFPDE